MARNVFTLVFGHHLCVIMNIMIRPTHVFFLCGLCCWSNKFFQVFHNLFCASTREGLVAQCKLLCKSMKTSIKNVIEPPQPNIKKKTIKNPASLLAAGQHFSNLQPGCSLLLNSPCFQSVICSSNPYVSPFRQDPCMLYMVTFIIHIPQMLAYISYMDPMGFLLLQLPLNHYSSIFLQRSRVKSQGFVFTWKNPAAGSTRKYLGSLKKRL